MHKMRRMSISPKTAWERMVTLAKASCGVTDVKSVYNFSSLRFFKCIFK